MDIWIINENDEIAASVRRSLQNSGIECLLDRVINIQVATSLKFESTKCDQLFFLIADVIHANHLEVIKDLRSSGDCKIIIVSPVSDHATTVSLFRAGASDLLTARQDLREEIGLLVTRLRSESQINNGVGKVITVIPSSCVSDASLLAVNLAASIASMANDCGLVDLHLRGGDIAPMLRMDPPHTMHDLLTQKDGVDEMMVEQAMARHPSGISLLASPPLFCELRTMQLQFCETIIQLVKSTRPCTIVNCDNFSYAEQLQALMLSDNVLLTTRLDIVSILRVKQTLSFLMSSQIATANLHVVAMRTGCPGELPIKSVCKLLDTPSLSSIPDDPVAVTVSLNVGNPFVNELPSSPMAKAVVALAKLIWSQHDAVPPSTDRKSHILSRPLKFMRESLLQ